MSTPDFDISKLACSAASICRCFQDVLACSVRSEHHTGYGGLGSLTWKMVLSRGLPEPASLPTSLAHIFTSKTSATAKANSELWRSKEVSSSPLSLQPTQSAWQANGNAAGDKAGMLFLPDSNNSKIA